MKIGLYGGTFDPIHHGHLILAREAREKLKLDRVYFIPCAQSPHKLDRAIALNGDRFEMLKLALKGEKRMKVSDFEIKKGGTSFAIDTVRFFKKKFPKATFFWLLGTDQKAKLTTWHQYPKLRRLVTFLFLHRGGLAKGSVIIRQVDISATEIRKRIKKRQSIRFLTPEVVTDYIKKHKIYRT